MNLERKKMEVELMKVSAARADLELRILERQEEIDRIKQSIEIQIKKEEELTLKLSTGGLSNV